MKIIIAAIIMTLLCVIVSFFGIYSVVNEIYQFNERFASLDSETTGLVERKFQTRGSFYISYTFSVVNQGFSESVSYQIRPVDAETYEKLDVSALVEVLYKSTNIYQHDIKGNRYDQHLQQRLWLYTLILIFFVCVIIYCTFSLVKMAQRRAA